MRRRWWAGCLLVALLAGCDSGGAPAPTATTPNILLVIMDDVGIDQMEAFGYGGLTPPSMPTIETIAEHGIRFHNTWAMPACTTTRAVLFDGRFPLRTEVKGALGPNDLANSMVSPYEMTAPKLLAQKGYASGLFGKFHLALQGHDPAGYGGPHDRGWNYFAGWLDETGDPSSIDTTAGGVADEGTWSCGFVRGALAGGADRGACYHADGSCRALESHGPIPPGRTCRDDGGIFVPEEACQSPPPDDLHFETLSAHYVSPYVINRDDGSIEQVPASDPRSRRFRATQAVDDAVAWIQARPAGQPWMATVSFASAHTPVMQPPVGDTDEGPAASDLDCADLLHQRVLTNLMIESMDHQIARLLLETGLAQRARDGGLEYDPAHTDTVLIVVGDNGSLGSVVKAPFSIVRSKGTAYQTGVWVPLLVAGPQVRQPGRVVSHMVNVADLFSLFGEIAGIEDVQAKVPRPIDAEPMLAYLTNPAQPSIRRWNYTEVGVNAQVGGSGNQPCVIAGLCSQIPVSKGVCEDNNGVWWGAGADAPQTEGIPPEGFDYCCEVNAFRASQGEPLYPITPLISVGIRNDHYKIVENSVKDYVSQDEPCVDSTTTEFYAIDEGVPVPALDDPGDELPLDALDPEQQANYDELAARLTALRASVVSCPGDGNIDAVVDGLDLDDWRFYAETSGLSSVYDLDLNGLTNDDDRSIIEANLGLDCRAGTNGD